jgi:molybdenum cofactor guanylyltransferase
MAIVLAGILVGGAGTRMGGQSKGLLSGPGGEVIAARLARLARDAGAEPLLVGDARAYAALGLEAIADEPSGIGPLGGLTALLTEAARLDARAAVALACDLPYLSARLLARLVAEAPDADALAPRQDGKWQPLFARYAPAPALAAARSALNDGERALFSVLRRLGPRAVELSLDSDEAAELRDWDAPSDVHS